MSARFRYVAEDGREVEVTTTDELVRAFTSGSLRWDTLLYDAYGGGWAPARSHSALLGKERSELAFTLAGDAPPETTADVVTKLLREREQGGDFPAAGARRDVDGIVTEALGASLLASAEPSSPAPPKRAEPSPYLRRVAAEATVERERGAPFEGPASLGPAPSVTTGPERPHPGATTLEPHGGAGVGAPSEPVRAGAGPSTARPVVTLVWPGLDRPRGAVGMLGAVAGALGGLCVVVFLFALLGDPGGAPGQAVREAAVAAGFGGPAPTGASELTLVEDRALDDMVAEMERQQANYRVDRVPSLWLEGIYLAEASRFPDVRTFWERYGSYVEAMRSAEGEMFRQRLLARLEGEGLSEAQRSMRVSRALRTFNGDHARRAAVYDAMRELSSAALDLHRFLVRNEGRITYAPATVGVSGEPITEAIPETRELSIELNGALDRLFLALEATQGNRIAPRDEIPQALRRGMVSDRDSSMN